MRRCSRRSLRSVPSGRRRTSPPPTAGGDGGRPCNRCGARSHEPARVAPGGTAMTPEDRTALRVLLEAADLPDGPFTWERIYERGEQVHWALCDPVSTAEGCVTDVQLILLATWQEQREWIRKRSLGGGIKMLEGSNCIVLD